MKLWLTLPILFLLAAPAGCDEAWNTAKSTHFVVYYQDAPEDFIGRVSSEAERHYEEISEDLGLLRHDFWLWDNRARIYVYDNDEAYMRGTGMPAWSAGAVIPRDKCVYVCFGKSGFFEHVLPHEIGHIIFREFVGFDNPGVPLWLDEGAASYQEKNILLRSARLAAVRDHGGLVPLARLSALNPHAMDSREDVELFYAQSVGVIDFLIERFGKDDFVNFCRSLREMRDLGRALSYVYSIRGIDELDRQWKEHLK